MIETQACSQLPPAPSPAGPWHAFTPRQCRPPSLRLSFLPVWRLASHIWLPCQGFAERLGQVLRAAICSEVLGGCSEAEIQDRCFLPHALVGFSLPARHWAPKRNLVQGVQTKVSSELFVHPSNQTGKPSIAQDPTCAPTNANWGPTESWALSVKCVVFL